MSLWIKNFQIQICTINIFKSILMEMYWDTLFGIFCQERGERSQHRLKERLGSISNKIITITVLVVNKKNVKKIMKKSKTKCIYLQIKRQIPYNYTKTLSHYIKPGLHDI